MKCLGQVDLSRKKIVTQRACVLPITTFIIFNLFSKQIFQDFLQTVGHLPDADIKAWD